LRSNKIEFHKSYVNCVHLNVINGKWQEKQIIKMECEKKVVQEFEIKKKNYISKSENPKLIYSIITSLYKTLK